MIEVKRSNNCMWEIVIGYTDINGYHDDEILLNTEDMQELSKKLKEAGF